MSQLQIHSGSSVIQRRASVSLQFPSFETLSHLSHPAVTAVTAPLSPSISTWTGTAIIHKYTNGRLHLRGGVGIINKITVLIETPTICNIKA